MIAHRFSSFETRAARCLITWWALSVVALAWWLIDYLSLDTASEWWSLVSVEFLGVAIVMWLAPGFLLGGWKALLVAAGRSSVRTRTDKALIVVFAAWAIGWPLTMVVGIVTSGAF